MVEADEIKQIARKVVNANTAPDAVVDVFSQDGLGWNGLPIVKVSVIISDEKVDLLQDEAPLNILSQLRDELADVGEERFPIIDYATPSELAAEQKKAATDDDYPAGPAF